MALRPLLAAALLLFAATALPAAARSTNVTDPDIPRALPEAGPVSVRWTDPARFTEIRMSANANEARRGNWVVDLAEHLRKRAEARLPAGERLDIEITDIKRAGDFEPGRAPQLHDVRVMRDLYPPRMTLNYRHTAADGRVIAESEARLSDLSYLHDSSRLVNNSDTLRYEKRMIDRWVNELLPTRR